MGEVEYESKGKPVLLILPGSESIPFSSLENAGAYLSSLRRVGLVAEAEGQLFQWRDGDWVEMT